MTKYLSILNDIENSKINEAEELLFNFFEKDIDSDETLQSHQRRIINTCILYMKYNILEILFKKFSPFHFEIVVAKAWEFKDIPLAKFLFQTLGKKMLEIKNLFPLSMNIEKATLDKSILYYLNFSFCDKYFEILKLYIIYGFDINTLNIDFIYIDPKIMKKLIVYGYDKNKENYSSYFTKEILREREYFNKDIITKRKYINFFN